MFVSSEVVQSGVSVSPTVPDYLEAVDGFLPWLTLLLVALILREPIRQVVAEATRRAKEGSPFKIWMLEIGAAKDFTTKTADLSDEMTKGQVLIEGDPDRLVLLMKAQGVAGGRYFLKSTKAMETPTGCLVQVSTEVATSDGRIATAEALTFVPGSRIQLDPDGVGGALVASD